MIDIAALKADLSTDPAGLGYAPLIASGDDVGLARLLNDPARGGPIARRWISAAELQGALDAAEFAAMSATDAAKWQCILLATQDRLPVDTGHLKQQLLAMLPSATRPVSRANLIALQAKQGSRAEVLFGDGSVVQLDDIVKLRSLP